MVQLALLDIVVASFVVIAVEAFAFLWVTGDACLVADAVLLLTIRFYASAPYRASNVDSLLVFPRACGGTWVGFGIIRHII